MIVRGIVAISLVAASFPVAAAGGEHRLERCGAVTLDDAPRPGSRGDFYEGRLARKVRRFKQNHADVFADAYLSKKYLYVGFTQHVCWWLRNFRKGLPEPWRARAFQADFSLRELRRARRCVSDLFSEKRWLTAVGIDVSRNSLTVWMKRKTERRKHYVERRCGTVRIRFREGTFETL